MAAGRNILAVCGGVVAAGIVIALVETVGHEVLAGPALFGAAAVGYGLGALAGTVVAARLADRRAARAVPLILGALAIVNLFAFPHPWWFVPGALLALAAGWAAGIRWSRVPNER